MKTYTAEELKAVVEKHGKWLRDEEGGERSDLQYADLQYADLQGACLQGADLQGADLQNIKLDVATKWPWYQLPEGDLIGWKKCIEGIVKLRIPAEAKRTASVVGRKCRAEYAVVIETPDHKPAHSWYGQAEPITYIEGKTVRPDKYDDNFLVECSSGVHFFACRGEAEEF